MEIDQAEWEKRERICTRKYLNFISRMTVDFGMFPFPVYELPTLQGTLELPAKNKFIIATDEDLKKAVENLEEADRRYKERKERKKTPKVSDVIGN